MLLQGREGLSLIKCPYKQICSNLQTAGDGEWVPGVGPKDSNQPNKRGVSEEPYYPNHPDNPNYPINPNYPETKSYTTQTSQSSQTTQTFLSLGMQEIIVPKQPKLAKHPTKETPELPKLK